MIAAATRQLIGLAGYAVAVITGLMSDRTVHASVRLRAAPAVLDELLKSRELTNLGERLAKLERQLPADH
jgi:hypothetical protein